MLGWAGFIAKLFEFILSKVIGQQIDLSLDRKKRVAKAFFEMHQSLTEIDRLLCDFEEGLQPIIAGEKDRIGGIWFRDYPKKIDKCSNNFLRALDKLSHVFMVYDPALCFLLSGVVTSKRDLMVGFSVALTEKMNFSMEWDGVMFDKIDHTAPSTETVEEAFEACYKAARSAAVALENHRHLPKGLKWPKGAVALLVADITERKLVLADDREAIIQFHSAITRHRALLSETINSLSKFIQDNFAIEDLL